MQWKQKLYGSKNSVSMHKMLNLAQLALEAIETAHLSLLKEEVLPSQCSFSFIVQWYIVHQM
jgi:hypothetical protein